MIKPFCTKCTLNGCDRIPHGIGNLNSPIVIISECPTQSEVVTGELFTGRSMQLLDRLLDSAHISRSDCYITTSVLCCPEPYRTPKAKEAKCCRERLMSEILDVAKRKVIITLGAVATKTILPGTSSVKQVRGSITHSDELDCYVVPTMHPAAILRDPKLYQDVAQDFTKAAHVAFKGVEGLINDGTIKYVYVDHQEMFDDMLLRLDEVSDIVALDVENVTATQELICLGLSWSERTAVVIPAEMLTACNTKRLSDKLVNRLLIMHNGKHDVNILKKHGFADTLRVSGDTMFQSYIIDETLYAKEEMRGVHGLKYLVQEVLGIPIWNGKVKKWYDDLRECPNMDDVWEYNAKDAAYTRMLYMVLQERVDDEGKQVMANIMYPVNYVLGQMQYTGALADRDYLMKLDIKLTLEQEARLHEMFRLAKCTFNPNSTPQLHYLLFKHLGLPVPGRLSADKDALEMLYDDHPLIPILQAYNERKKFHGTYVRGILNNLDENDRVHTSFNVARTATGRLSSSNPNVQNIKRGSEGRNIFRATPGWLWLEGDESQAEVRMWCMLSHDPVLQAAIMGDIDIHTATACNMHKTKPENITKVMRTGAKKVTFGTIFLMSPHGLVVAMREEGIRIGIPEAEELQRMFFSAYKIGKQWIDDSKADVLRTHLVTTVFGRKRHFPYITKENRSSIQRQAVNFPIQSAASDVTLQALVRIGKRVDAGEAGDTRLILTVHDSIDSEVRPENLYTMAKIKKYEMERPVLDNYVPFVADLEYGEIWGELSKLKIA